MAQSLLGWSFDKELAVDQGILEGPPGRRGEWHVESQPCGGQGCAFQGYGEGAPGVAVEAGR